MNKTFQTFYPASKFELENLKAGIDICQNILNLEPILTSPPQAHNFYAGTTEERGASFLSALKSSANLIWAARGGYGTIEWLDSLGKATKLYRDKTFIGFSDLTSLHNLFSNEGYSSIHGPMLASQNFLNASEEELQSLSLCIEQQTQFYEIRNGKILSGRLVGGNLSVLSHCMGTPWQLILTPGDILFLEDINEAPYALARSLKQLSYSPHFNDCHILWGQLTNCGQSKEEKLINMIMEPYTNSWSFGLRCGHDLPNYSIRLGTEVKLTRNQLAQSF